MDRVETAEQQGSPWLAAEPAHHGPTDYGSDVPDMASVGGVKVSAHYCGPHVPDPDARPRGAGGVGAHGDAATEAAAAARVAEVVASNARLVRATCPHLETAPHYYGCPYSGYTYSGYTYSGYSYSGYTYYGSTYYAVRDLPSPPS